MTVSVDLITITSTVTTPIVLPVVGFYFLLAGCVRLLLVVLAERLCLVLSPRQGSTASLWTSPPHAVHVLMRQTTKSINPQKESWDPPSPPFSKAGLSDEMPVIVISWAGCSISSKFLALDFRHCAPNGWGSAKVCLTHFGSPRLIFRLGFSILSLLSWEDASQLRDTCDDHL